MWTNNFCSLWVYVDLTRFCIYCQHLFECIFISSLSTIFQKFLSYSCDIFFLLLLRSFLFQFFPTIKFIHGFIMSLNSNEKFFCFSRLKLEKLTISILLSCVSIYFLTKCNERILNEKNICQLNKAVLIIKKTFL